MQQLYETKERAKKAFLVSINGGGASGPGADSRELQRLAESLGLEIAGLEMVRVRERQPKFGMGSGKAEELAKKAAELEADCLVFDWDPSPSQQRNWEELAGIPALDRQELIIRIFADRAATREAELQVQAAELSYFLPRLSHKYIDLSRQRGGRYGTRGAGETRLETDRRRIKERISRLEKELLEIQKQRQVRRRQRERQGLPVCAIVGYTNAGKSSLLNALTGADVPVEDKLFATLDTAARRFEPEPGTAALLTDTVGFIRRLPHSLVKAFRSTLEEAVLADILIHVLDASEPDINVFYDTTLSVLRELGGSEPAGGQANTGESSFPDNIPVITVLNKIDRVPLCDELLSRFPGAVPVSAVKRTGLDELKKRIAESLKGSVM